MGVKIIEVDAKNDTNVELANVESLLQQHIDLLLLEGEPESFGRFDPGREQSEGPRRPLQYPRGGRRICHFRGVEPD